MSIKEENVSTNTEAVDAIDMSEAEFAEASGSELLPGELTGPLGDDVTLIVPNIKFVGRVGNTKFIDKDKTPDELEWIERDAPKKLTIGKLVFELPDSETQANGFFHPEAHLIIRTFPRLYKRFVEKGAE